MARRLRRLRGWVDAHPVRFGVLFAALQVTLHTLFLLCYFGTLADEEQYFGNLAKDLGEGLIAGLLDYRVNPREGGFFPFNFWAFVFFRLLGPNLLALRLAAVSLMAAGTWPWVDVARRVGGPRGAVLMALLFLLPCPFYLRMTLFAPTVAVHLGTIIFSGAATWFVYRGFVDGTLRRDRAAVGAGVALGIGCYWCFSFWPLAVGIGLAALLLPVGRRAVALALLGMLPGLALTWFLCIRTIGGGGLANLAGWSTPGALVDHAAPKVAVTLTGVAAEARRLLLDVFPRAAGFTEAGSNAHGPKAIHPSWIYYALVLGGAALVVTYRLRWRRGGSRRRARALLLLLLPLPVYLAFYLASGLYVPDVGLDAHRYFLPVAPYAFLLIAAGLAGLPGLLRRGRALAAAAAPAGLLTLGLVSAADVVDPHAFPTPASRANGFNMAYLGRRDGFDIGLALPGRSDYALLARWKGEDAAARARGGFRMAARVPGLPRPLWADFWVGFGYRHAVPVYEGDADGARLRRLARGGPSWRRVALFRGVARAGLASVPPEEQAAILPYAMARLEGLPDAALNDAMRGLCQGLGETQPAVEFTPGLASLPEDCRDLFLRGAAASLARHLRPRRPWPARVPIPVNWAAFSTVAPRRFRRWADEERVRLLRIEETYARRPPLSPAAPPGERDRITRGGAARGGSPAP